MRIDDEKERSNDLPSKAVETLFWKLILASRFTRTANVRYGWKPDARYFVRLAIASLTIWFSNSSVLVPT